MISFQSRDVLRHLKELADNTDTELALLGMTTLICPTGEEDKTYDYSKYGGEINSILDELVNAGYLIYPRNNKYFISLTSKGIHTHQFTVGMIKDWLVDKSIDIAALIISIIALVRTF